MKALVLTRPGHIEFKEVPTPTLTAGKALVKIKSAGLNRRDDWIRQGKYPNIHFGVIMGSDGAGVVEDVFEEVDREWIGKDVIINPNIDWGNDPEVQSKNYTILGMPFNGTFAEYALVNVDRLQLKPTYLDFLQAASLPLGGLTAYRALFKKGKLKSGQNILISGFGGGVADFRQRNVSIIASGLFRSVGDSTAIFICKSRWRKCLCNIW
jgi:NADPH:quinone reductase-like Zn-dependent oxidoreductase